MGRLALGTEARALEVKCDEAWRSFDQASRDIDRQKDAIFDGIATRLMQSSEHERLFSLRWVLE